jgi:hypothetical protein
MTPQDHNKVIGIMHLIWGGFNALTMLILVPLFLIFMGVIASDPSAPAGLPLVFGFVGILFLFLALFFALPSVIAAYGMLKRKSWAKIAAIVSSCLCAFSFPFGTALCVYTFWFLFSGGENFYRAGRGRLARVFERREQFRLGDAARVQLAA